MTEVIMWISLAVNLAIFTAFGISFILAARRTHDVKYQVNSLGIFTLTATVDKDKTTRFLKAKNRAILKQNAKIKSENTRISIAALVFMLFAVFAVAVKDKVTNK